MAGQLWGWLGQAHDPLEGKSLAEQLLREKLGLSAFKSAAPNAFHGATLRPTRLDETAMAALAERFGVDGFSVDPFARAALSLGQSYPDQLARRTGIVADPVDAVVLPASETDAMDLLAMAARYGFCVTPCGGATNVTGGFADSGDRPRVAADMRRMERLLDLNATDLTAEAEAGIHLAAFEAQLGAQGYTLGHFPQSFHGVTLGGALAADGAGQRSNGYGRMADMVISCALATPRGLWRTEKQRHAAGGPWLGALVAGSEGLFGIITCIRVRIARKPQAVEDRAFLLPNFDAAVEAARALVQSGAGLSMLRISDEDETEFLGQLRLAMKGLGQAPVLERLALSIKQAPRRGALALAGFEGTVARQAGVLGEVTSVMRQFGGTPLGARPGESWRKGRYDLPYLRESLLRRGIGVDTFETVAPWSQIAGLKAAASQAFDRAMAANGSKSGHGLLLCHLSHSYRESACLYFTALFPQADDAPGQWRAIKSALSAAFAENGGAPSHHHGIGSDHADMARAAKGEIGVALLRALKVSLDPQNLLVSGISRLLG